MSANFMYYKGYTASVDFSADDRCFVGRVLGTRDVIGFHGESVDELEKDFRETIDFYLDACDRHGKEPDRPFTGKLMVKLPSRLLRDISLTSEATGKSVDTIVLEALRSADFRSPVKAGGGSVRKRTASGGRARAKV